MVTNSGFAGPPRNSCLGPTTDPRIATDHHKCPQTCLQVNVVSKVVDSVIGSEPAAPARKQLKMKRNAEKKCKALSSIFPNDLGLQPQ